MSAALQGSAGERLDHVPNRANARRALLHTDDDELFARVFVEGHERVGMRGKGS